MIYRSVKRIVHRWWPSFLAFNNSWLAIATAAAAEAAAFAASAASSAMLDFDILLNLRSFSSATTFRIQAFNFGTIFFYISNGTRELWESLKDSEASLCLQAAKHQQFEHY